jgi:hypothetical protein
MRYLRNQHCIHPRKLSEEDGLLDKEWSCSKALLACAAVAVSQSQYAYRELEQLKLERAATKVARNRSGNRYQSRLAESNTGDIRGCGGI